MKMKIIFCLSKKDFQGRSCVVSETDKDSNFNCFLYICWLIQRRRYLQSPSLAPTPKTSPLQVSDRAEIPGLATQTLLLSEAPPSQRLGRDN